jgi:hypothetical protein
MYVMAEHCNMYVMAEHCNMYVMAEHCNMYAFTPLAANLVREVWHCY